MNRRERLMATMRGEKVDRPPVSFYEISGEEETSNNDKYNIYNDSSWAPLIKLAKEETDRIVLCKVSLKDVSDDPWDHFTKIEKWEENGSLFTKRTISTPTRELTRISRRDPDVNTLWEIEHLLKDEEDLKALLSLPVSDYKGEPDITAFLEIEERLGDTGIAAVDTPDPLCHAAELFGMGEYTITALMEQELFHKLLQVFADRLNFKTEAIAKALPGRLWRIFGPEYATPPFLPPNLFKEFVVTYDGEMIKSIHKYGGFARIHSHGNILEVLDDLVATGCMGIDPIEPPPQGNVSLSYVRKKYGKDFVLFGNLEANDITNLPVKDFEMKVRQALKEGTEGTGRGFVLMPSGAPYGRILQPLALENYRKMIEVVKELDNGK